MAWQTQLITLYVYICTHYQSHLWVYCQRMSPYADLSFSDEEVICIYLWGIMEKRRDIKQIYDHTERYLKDWFPLLPSYGGRDLEHRAWAERPEDLLDCAQRRKPGRWAW